MGKKGTKRKTQWRTLSITEQDEQNSSSVGITEQEQQQQQQQQGADLCNGKNLNIDEGSVGSVDDNFNCSRTNYLYLKRKSSSLSSSSNYNNNRNSNNDYRYNYANYYYNKHNNSFTTNATTANNDDTITTTNNPQNNQYSNFSASHRYSYKRKPFSTQNGSNGSSKYYSSYGAGRATSRPNRQSYKFDDTTTTNNKENLTKSIFNEDEYTRITTPRQDVIFKKGYFSKPKPFLCSTDTNTTSSASASVVSNDESISAVSVPSSLSPEQSSSSQSDSMFDPEQALMYSYVDQNGIIYVNPYMPNGFDQYPSGQMIMLPYGYPPYNYYPSDLNTPPLNEEINTDEQKNNEQNEKTCESVLNKDLDKETPTLIIGENPETNSVDSNDSTSCCEEVVKDQKSEKSDEAFLSPQYDEHIVNHYGPDFINYGYNNQFYPPVFYPVHMLNGQPFLPVVGSGYEASSECMDEDSDDKDNHSNARSQRPIVSDRNSTGATTTDYSEDEDSDKDNVIEKIDLTREILPRIENLPEENEKLLAHEMKMEPTIKNNETCDIVCKGESSSNTEETESKIIKLNTNVEEFIPKVNKPHLNVNVREFQPRNYHDSKDRMTNEIKKDDETNINTEAQQAKNYSSNRPTENNDIRGISINKKIAARKPDKLTLAETIKQSLAGSTDKRKPSVGSPIINRNSSQTQDNNKKKTIQIIKGNKVNKKMIKVKGTKKIDLTPLSVATNDASELSNSDEFSPKQNVLSYAQILNKDLLNDSITKDTISTDHLINTTNDDIDVQILIESIEAAEQNTAISIKEKKTCWQTVKRGKRGKQIKEIADIGFDEEEFGLLKEDILKEDIEKSKPLVTEIHLQEEEKLAAAEEQSEPLEKDKVISIEKKKSKSRKKKIVKKTDQAANKITNLKLNKIEISEHQKTDDDFEADPDKLARKLFEDLEQEIDLSLKVESVEDESENILNEIYSPPGLIRKSYGLNPLEIRNSFDKKLPSGILKEEEEMVLNVIKSLSSTPVTSAMTQKNLFNMSFLQEICNKQEGPQEDENKKTIFGKNTISNQDVETGIYKENPENEQCAKYIQNCIKESYKYITQKNDLTKNNEVREFSESDGDGKLLNIESGLENKEEDEKNITSNENQLTIQSYQQNSENLPENKTDELKKDNITAVNSSLDAIQIEIKEASEISGVEINFVSSSSLQNENEIENVQTQNKCITLNGYEDLINEKIEYPENDEKLLNITSDAFPYSYKECNENSSPDSVKKFEILSSCSNVNEWDCNETDEDSNGKQMESTTLNEHNPNECNKIYSNVSENIENCSQYLSESCEELNKDSSCNHHVLERQNSSISLEMQLKSLEQQLKKFDNIQTNPISDYGNDCPVVESSLQSVYKDTKIKSSSVTNLLSNCCQEETKMVQFNESYNIPTTFDHNDSNPNFSAQNDSTEFHQFPLTEAVKLWLVNESKEKTPEPLLRLPGDPLLSTVIRSTLEKKTEHYYLDHEEECSTTDDEVYDNDQNNETKYKNNEINDKTMKQESKIKDKDSKNLKSNPLHVSSVNNCDNHMDIDSDYNSDGQIKYDDDDDNTCERVAMKNSSDFSSSIKDICVQKHTDLLEFWDDEFIENPQKWLSPENANKENQTIIEKLKYPINANQLLTSNSASASDELKPYESLYGKTVNYDQLLANYLSNNVTNKNYKNDTLLLNNNNNNHFDNNINNNNNNKDNCLKPPEICCILM